MLSPALDRNGSPAIKQQVTPPSVYLDHWALMDFAHDESLRDRFTKALLRRKGTLLVSWLHLLEMNPVKSPATSAEVEEFFEGLDLHIAFLQPLPDFVIAEEDRLLSIPPEEWNSAPHLDRGLLELAYRFSKPPAIFGFRGLWTTVQSSEFDELRRQFERGMADSARLLERKREQLLEDPRYEKAIRAPSVGPRIAAPTRYVVRETINSLIADNRKSMSPKEWIDLGHMNVSVSYADFVLLDRAWEHRADIVRRKIQKAGLLTHFARVYSDRTLEDFWKEFDV
jgi:hypothetical protein